MGGIVEAVGFCWHVEYLGDGNVCNVWKVIGHLMRDGRKGRSWTSHRRLNGMGP